MAGAWTRMVVPEEPLKGLCASAFLNAPETGPSLADWTRGITSGLRAHALSHTSSLYFTCLEK